MYLFLTFIFKTLKFSNGQRESALIVIFLKNNFHLKVEFPVFIESHSRHQVTSLPRAHWCYVEQHLAADSCS